MAHCSPVYVRIFAPGKGFPDSGGGTCSRRSSSRMIWKSPERPMRSASLSATVSNMTRTVQRLWPIAKRYWFDALLVAGIGVSIASAVSGQHTKNGPDGPLWFDVIASVAFLVPFFFRRRYPFGAPAAVAVVIA